jgi:hypothetical protein
VLLLVVLVLVCVLVLHVVLVLDLIFVFVLVLIFVFVVLVLVFTFCFCFCCSCFYFIFFVNGLVFVVFDFACFWGVSTVVAVISPSVGRGIIVGIYDEQIEWTTATTSKPFSYSNVTPCLGRS